MTKLELHNLDVVAKLHMDKYSREYVLATNPKTDETFMAEFNFRRKLPRFAIYTSTDIKMNYPDSQWVVSLIYYRREVAPFLSHILNLLSQRNLYLHSAEGVLSPHE